MVTTVTTTTMSAVDMGTDMGLIATIGLISLLVVKELAGSSTVTEPGNAEQSDRWYKLKALASRVNVAVYPLLFVFAGLVTYRVMDILTMEGFANDGFWVLFD